jgi:uncharacterized protein (DUF2147 family)
LVKQRYQQAQMDDQQQQMQRRQQIQDLALKFAKPDGTFDMPGYQQALAGLQAQKVERDLNTAQTREVNSGDNILTQEQQGDGSWKTIATAPRWNPK